MTAVAIYTDASIFQNRGAWATVIIREGSPPVESAGMLKGGFRSSASTEIAAIANALHFARRSGLVERGDRVEVRSDNMAAVLRIRGGVRDRGKTDPRLIEVATYIAGFAELVGVELVALHVKGHQRLDSRDPHAFHNRRCDQLCSAIRDGRKPPSIKTLRAQHDAAQASRDRKEAAEGRAAHKANDRAAWEAGECPA